METKILTSIMLALQELVWPHPNQHMVEPLMVESILVEHLMVEPSWWSTS